MARDKGAGKVAEMLGNSPQILLTRYRELVGPEAAERFWGRESGTNIAKKLDFCSCSTRYESGVAVKSVTVFMCEH